jgi:hypothetical protein
MPNTKPRQLRGQELKKANSELSKLRKLGLYSGKAARGQPTKYARQQINRFRDVLDGKAAVIEAPKSARQKYKGSESLDFKGSKIIVPKNPLSGERVTYSKREKSIKIFGDAPNGKRYTKRLIGPDEFDRIVKPAPGKEIIYQVPFGRDRRMIGFDNFNELQKFMAQHYPRYTNYRDYLEEIEVDVDQAQQIRDYDQEQDELDL